jgi:hypothetical protein
MDLDRKRLQEQVSNLNRDDLEEHGQHGAERMLDQARQWDLSDIPTARGIVSFAHVNVTVCCLHVAAAVLHAFTDEMEKGVSLIEAGEFWASDRHCVLAKRDDRDVAPLYRFLRGPLKGSVVDLAFSDSTPIYDQPSPTWAASGFTQVGFTQVAPVG